MPDLDVSVKAISANNILNGSSIISKDTAYQPRAIVGSLPHDKLTDRFDDISNGNFINLTVSKSITFTPSSVTNIVGATGITPTSPVMIIQGSGGAVTVTANPAIAAGTDGQMLTLIGNSDTNIVSLTDGNGIHLHGDISLKDDESITFIYHATNSQWIEISRSTPRRELVRGFNSPAGATGTFYVGGFYEFSGTINDFDPAITFGTVNNSKAAHFMIVLGATTVDVLTIRVTGTSITDAAVRTAGDTQDIVIPSGAVANTYYETSKKWLGQITISVVSGTPKNCNYGFCKYWDNNNNDFAVMGLEATWLAGASDNAPNISLLHHKSTGWTYNAVGAPVPPTAIANMNSDHVTEIVLTNGEHGAWKRTDLATIVAGSGSEGIIWSFTTSANKAFGNGNLTLTIKPT